MDRESVRQSLDQIKEVRNGFALFKAEHESGLAFVMERLLNEALRHKMSVEEIADRTGHSPKVIRYQMRTYGLTGRSNGVLSRQAAANLENNAALMSIDPADMDLTSPLAYLPMGRRLKMAFLETTAGGVHEISEEPVVHGVSPYSQDENDLGCGLTQWDRGVVMTNHEDLITCAGCRAALVRGEATA